MSPIDAPASDDDDVCIHELEFDLAPVCIGRSRDCELSLSSDVSQSRVVSKKHARVYPCLFNNNQEVRWFLKDLDSKHGTSVNGHDVKSDSSVQVFDGDHIVLARQHGDFFSIKCHLDGRGNSKLILVTQCPLNPRARAGSSSAVVPATNHSGEKRKLADEKELFVKKKFRALEEDPLRHGESPLKCPVCFEYFMESLTLSCSHTFCGGCLRSWLLQSMTCPTCRLPVTEMPVRTRALDDLCVQLVDPTDAAWAARQDAYAVDLARQVKKAKKIRHAFLETRSLPWPKVWTHWGSRNEREVFLQTISTTIGAVREAWCEAVGLTDDAIDAQPKAKLAIAAKNLLDEISNHTRSGVLEGADLRHRLRMFLRYG
ncbi:Aste57867_20607 [Aphanomyces stellatus]|uniref:E3 ubiquitin-protein ligase CHFR n=1 Tax=Aphanomyces stellatus TaxID=120398 RepID=A0A485LGH9_9STRA|nr:hypothetical protein As57867_020539 [Aphanomyces stellatus]VFT97287.1 Aste57867_20607 [Aphanomyces stellatus]